MADFKRPVVGTIYDSKAGQRTAVTVCIGAIDPSSHDRNVLLTLVTLDNDVEIRLTTADAREIASRLLVIAESNDAGGRKAL